MLDHDRLFANLHNALLPGGWLEAQCGGGLNVARLRARADELAETPKFAAYFAAYSAGFREPWFFQDAEGAAFVRNIIFRRHLENLPTEELRAEFIESLTQLDAADDPPFSLDYWRLNLRGRVVLKSHVTDCSIHCR